PGRVNRMVLVASAGIRNPQTMRTRARVRLFKAGRRLSTANLVPPAVRSRLQQWVARQGSDDYRAATGVMRATLVRLVNSDARQLLKRIDASTLLVWGDRDTETPIGNAYVMNELLRDSGVVVLDG